MQRSIARTTQVLQASLEEGGWAYRWLPGLLAVAVSLAFGTEHLAPVGAALALTIGFGLLVWPWQGFLVLFAAVIITTGKPDRPGQTTFFSATLPHTSLTIVEFGILFLLLAALIRRLLNSNWRVYKAPFIPWLLLFFGLVLISYARAAIGLGEPGRLYELRQYTMLLAGFALVVLLLDRQTKIRWYVWTLAFAVGVRGFVGVVHFLSLLQRGTAGKVWALYGGWGDTFVFLMYLALFLAYWVAKRDARALRWLAWFLVPVLLAFLLSMRRSFLLGAFAMLIALLALFPKERKKVLWISSTIVLVGFVSLLASGQADRFIARVSLLTRPWQDASLLYRVVEFANVWENAKRHLLFGLPLGTPWKAYYQLPLPVLNPIGSHNTYLNILLRTGLLGLTAFGLASWKFLSALWPAATRPGQSFWRVVAIWALLVEVAFLVSAFTAPLFEDKISFLFGTALGVGAYVMHLSPRVWGPEAVVASSRNRVDAG